MDNQIRIKKGLKVVTLAVYGLLTIITCAGVWNFCPETSVKWFTGVLMACNALSIYYYAKNIKTGE